MSTPRDYAQTAIRYTQQQLGVFPSNHIAQRVMTLGGSTSCVSAIRSHYGPSMTRNRIMNIRRMAASAKSSGCGNCGEYAAVVFDYLMLNYCPFSIEYAGYVSPGDHAFVIINRPLRSTIGSPGTWGRDVFVADAWDGNVVHSSRYWIDMPSYPNRVHAPEVSARFHLMGDFTTASEREWAV